MQSLGFSPSPAEIVAGTLYCCECNLCSLYACPEDLDPKNVCVRVQARGARQRALLHRNAGVGDAASRWRTTAACP